jgi:uncharacterized protein YnzC (UPF0291/DUF896 family)
MRKTMSDGNHMDGKIARINELYHKSKAEGLTEEEKKEQAALRSEYIANVRANLRGQLNGIDIQEKDGSITNLGEKYGKKRTH